MKQIPLTRGKVALVDDEDYEYLSQFKWTYLSAGYAYRQPTIDGTKEIVLMHRKIISAQKGEIVDHINRDKLDNRRENLRIVTRQGNTANSPSRKGSTSKFKGVFLHRKSNSWYAQIQVHGHRKHLGCFKDEIEAAIAYNSAADKYFGNGAYLNQLERTS